VNSSSQLFIEVWQNIRVVLRETIKYTVSSSQHLSLVLSHVSSVGACTFRTVTSHPQATSALSVILSLTSLLSKLLAWSPWVQSVTGVPEGDESYRAHYQWRSRSVYKLALRLTPDVLRSCLSLPVIRYPAHVHKHQVTCYCTKMKSEAGQTPCYTLFHHPWLSRSSLLLGRCSSVVQMLTRCIHEQTQSTWIGDVPASNPVHGSAILRCLSVPVSQSEGIMVSCLEESDASSTVAVNLWDNDVTSWEYALSALTWRTISAYETSWQDLQPSQSCVLQCHRKDFTPSPAWPTTLRQEHGVATLLVLSCLHSFRPRCPCCNIARLFRDYE
jgi:hypothetical protein